MKRFQLSAALLTAVMLAGAGIPTQAAEDSFHRTKLGEYKLVTEPDSETEPKTLRYASTKRENNIYSVYGDGSSGVKIEFDFDKAEATEKMDEIVAALKKAVPEGFNFQNHSTYGMFNQNEFRITHLNYREAAALYDTISKQYPLKAFHYYPDCGSFNGITGMGEPSGNCADCLFNEFAIVLGTTYSDIESALKAALAVSNE